MFILFEKNLFYKIKKVEILYNKLFLGILLILLLQTGINIVLHKCVQQTIGRSHLFSEN